MTEETSVTANLLLVDDDLDISEAFAEALGAAARTGSEGRACALDERPELIASDVEMLTTALSERKAPHPIDAATRGAS